MRLNSFIVAEADSLSSSVTVWQEGLGNPIHDLEDGLSQRCGLAVLPGKGAVDLLREVFLDAVEGRLLPLRVGVAGKACELKIGIICLRLSEC